MSDPSLNYYVASGDSATRTAFTPDPATPAGGPDPSYLWWDTDDQLLYAYDFGLADWVATGGGAGSGAVVQVKNTQTGAVATGTTVIPFDDTIPQNTEGDEYMTLAITPTDAANKLRIEVVAFVTHNAAAAWATVALFQDATANALAAQTALIEQTTGGLILTLSHWMTAGTTSATTFKARIGGSAAGTTTFNGTAGARRFGGVCASSITITEIVP